MARKTKNYRECRKTKDWLDLAEGNDKARLERNSGGSHPYKVIGPKGSMPLPDYGNQTWGKSLISMVRRQWVAIGLGIVAVIIFIS